MDDLQAACYCLLDTESSKTAEVLKFLQEPPDSWDEHIFNTALFILEYMHSFAENSERKNLIFFSRAGLSGERYRPQSRLRRGDGDTLMKGLSANGVRIASTPIAHTTANFIFQWVFTQIDRYR